MGVRELWLAPATSSSARRRTVRAEWRRKLRERIGTIQRRVQAAARRPVRVDLTGATRQLSSMGWPRLTLVLALRAVRDPRTASALVRVAWRFRRRGWWHRFPFLPLPARDYLRWRMHTAYGDYDAVPPAEDVIRFARWAVSE